MNKKLKTAKIGFFISALAMLIAAGNVLLSALNGVSNGSSITIALCTIAVFCCNLSIYAAQKKKDDNNTK